MTTSETTVSTSESAETSETTTTTGETTPTEPDYLFGDVNEDGEIGVEDAQLTLNAYVKGIAGKESGLSEKQIKAADVNEDGIVSVDDAQTILIYYVKNTIAKVPTTWEDLLGKKPQAQTLPAVPERKEEILPEPPRFTEDETA